MDYIYHWPNGSVVTNDILKNSVLPGRKIAFDQETQAIEDRHSSGIYKGEAETVAKWRNKQTKNHNKTFNK